MNENKCRFLLRAWSRYLEQMCSDFNKYGMEVIDHPNYKFLPNGRTRNVMVEIPCINLPFLYRDFDVKICSRTIENEDVVILYLDDKGRGHTQR